MSYTVLTLFVLVSLGLIVKHIRSCLSFPSASGPASVKWSKIWYLVRIWRGDFEKYDIDAHCGGAKKVVRVGPKMYSIDDPATARILYGAASPFLKSKWYKAWGDPRIPNHNLFSATDRDVHGTMRRKVGNMYAMTTIKSYEPHADSCIDLLLQRLDEFAENGRTFDLQHYLRCYAFDVIGAITFGKRVGFLESGGQDIDGIMRKLENGVSFSTFAGESSALLAVLFAVYGNPVAGIGGFAKKLERAETDSEVKTGGETFMQKVHRLRETDPEGYEKYRLENVTLFGNVAAGSDTTSISLTGALYRIFTTKGVARRMHEELASNNMLTEERITFDQAQQLPYLQMVIKESLRVHPVVGLPMWREINGAGLDIDGTHFPAGAIVGINPWVAHRNKEIFGKDAAEFVPDRWDPKQTSPEKLAAMEQYYLAFGAGARTCIGRHISHLEMVKLIPEIVKRYDFEGLKDELTHCNRWFVKPEPVECRVRMRTS